MSHKNVIALYDRFQDAQDAVNDLLQAGLGKDQIALLANNVDGRHPATRSNPVFAKPVDDPEAKAMTPPIVGAELGGGVGGILGLLVGVGAFAIPGVGPVIAAGWWAPLLAGLGAGAVVGGAIGALKGGGVEDADAHLYTEGLRRGGTLICAKVGEDQVDHITQILKARHAIDIEKRGSAWKADGWVSFDAETQPLSAAEIDAIRTRETAAGHEADHHHAIRHYFHPDEARINGGAANVMNRYGEDEIRT